MGWRALLYVWFAFALLLAQQGGAAHALSHLSEQLPAHSRQQGQDKQLPHSPACDKCVVYAGVGNAIGVSVVPPVPAEGVFARGAFSGAAILAHAGSVYRSRAPPRLV
jgi:hypothetical protein